MNRRPSKRDTRAGERATWRKPPTEGDPRSVVASNWKRIDKNTLIGTVDPRWRIIFRGCTWHRKGDKEWVNFGARESTDRAGTKQYAVLVQFTDDETQERFQIEALAAVRAIVGSAER